MNLTMFKRLATDVAPPIAALLAFIAFALAISLPLEPYISKRPVVLGLEAKST